eukprot:gene20322-biopygen2562
MPRTIPGWLRWQTARMRRAPTPPDRNGSDPSATTQEMMRTDPARSGPENVPCTKRLATTRHGVLPEPTSAVPFGNRARAVPPSADVAFQRAVPKYAPSPNPAHRILMAAARPGRGAEGMPNAPTLRQCAAPRR